MDSRRFASWLLLTLTVCALGFLSCYKSGQDSDDAGKADATQDSSLLDGGSDADVDADADGDTDTDADADADTDADSGLDADIHRPDGGNLIWVKQAGGTGYDQGLAVATAGDAIFITGKYSSAGATFGKDEANQTVLDSHGGSDIFLARYNADGTLAWAKRAGGPGAEEGASVAADENGNVYLVGTFEETCMFGEGEPEQTELTSRGYSDAYIAKFDATGTLIWAHQEGSISTDYGTSITLLDDGSILVTGRLYGDATFDQGGPNEKTLPMGFFIAKYKSDGNLIWVKGVSDARGAAEAKDIAVLPDGSFYVTGYFSDVVFGPGEPNETEISKWGLFDEDIFLAKYDYDGTFLWARKAGGTADDTYLGPRDSGEGINAQSDGTFFIAGDYFGPAVFGEGDPTETLLSQISYHAFLARYDRNGILSWVRSTNRVFSTAVYCSRLSEISNGNIFLVGVFQGDAVWGNGEEYQDIKSSYGYLDVYYSKYDISTGNFQWVKQAGHSEDVKQYGNDISISAENTLAIVGNFEENISFGIGEPKETLLTSFGESDVFIAKTSQ